MTRSRTVCETSTSEGLAIAAMRAPTLTATPPTFVSSRSTSPVWSPAQLESERLHGRDDRARTPDRARGAVERREEAVARRIELGPSIAGEQGAHGRVVSGDQLRPSAIAELAARSVEPTMSVKSTVARTRSKLASSSSSWARKRPISPTMSLLRAYQWKW